MVKPLFDNNERSLTKYVRIKLFTTLETYENLLDSNEQMQNKEIHYYYYYDIDSK